MLRALSEEEGMLSERIREEIIEEVDLTRDLTDEEIRSHIRERVLDEGHEHQIPLQERLMMEERIFNSLRKLDILEELLAQDDITEIMVNGPITSLSKKAENCLKAL